MRSGLRLALCLLAACSQAPEVGVSGEAADGLVFVRSVAGQLDLARARIADGAVRPLTRTPDQDERWPYWSTLADRLVFQRGAAGARDQSDLWLLAPGAGEVRLTDTPRRAERWPAWSPVAPALVFAFRGGEPAQGLGVVLFGSGAPQLRVATPGGAAAAYLRPEWAPEGDGWVAQRRNARDDSSLWRVAADGSARAITRDPRWFDLKAHFVRGGERILFSRRPAAGGRHEVVSVDPQGGDLRRHAGGPDEDAHSARPSPTRDEAVYVSRRGGNADVLLVDLAGGPARPLTHTPDQDEVAPRWSPDGERIVVTVTPSRPQGSSGPVDPADVAEAQLRVLDREGRTLLETPGFMADWMPAW